MDTKFWGPSGWKMLHLITFRYDPSNKVNMRDFFSSMPFILPCKFCRTSLTEYMEEDPLEPALASRDSLSRWLWRIHNKVNNKLRSQGLLKEPDTPFNTVRALYKEDPKEFQGWDFLFSVAEGHPYSRLSMKSIPMQDCPENPQTECIVQKNKWNIMKPSERYSIYIKFWESIGKVLPYPWDAWDACKFNIKSLETRASLIKQLWKIKCCMEGLKKGFRGLCKRLASHRSGCSTKKKAKTCRKLRTGKTRRRTV